MLRRCPVGQALASGEVREDLQGLLWLRSRGCTANASASPFDPRVLVPLEIYFLLVPPLRRAVSCRAIPCAE